MRKEVTSAVEFLRNLLKASRRDVSERQLDTFQQNLCVLLCSHYQNHWFPEKPCKGSGYRCIRINHKMDPLVTRAGVQCGIAESDLFHLLPSELTLWVDPDEVSYRIGEDGSIGVIFGENSDYCEFGESCSSSSSDVSSTDSASLEEFPSIHSCQEEYRHSMEVSPHMRSMNWEYMTPAYVASQRRLQSRHHSPSHFCVCHNFPPETLTISTVDIYKSIHRTCILGTLTKGLFNRSTWTCVQ